MLGFDGNNMMKHDGPSNVKRRRQTFWNLITRACVALIILAPVAGMTSSLFGGSLGDVYPSIKRVTSIKMLAENSSVDSVSHVGRIIINTTDSTASSTSPVQRSNTYTMSSEAGVVMIVFNRVTHERHDVFLDLSKSSLPFDANLSNMDIALASVTNNADLMVIIASRGTVAQSLMGFNSRSIITKLKSLGAPDTIDQLGSLSAFLFVGYKGLGSGNGVFVMNDDGPALGATLLLDRDLIGTRSILTPIVSSSNFPTSPAPVTTDKLAAGAITSALLGAIAVKGPEITAGAVDTTKIQDNAVTTAVIQNSAVTSDKILNGAVGFSKFSSTAIKPVKIQGPTMVYYRLFSPCDIASAAVTTILGDITFGSTTCPGTATNPTSANKTNGTTNTRSAVVTKYSIDFDAYKSCDAATATCTDNAIAFSSKIIAANTLSASDSYVFTITADMYAGSTSDTGGTSYDNDPAFGLFDGTYFMGCVSNHDNTSATTQSLEGDVIPCGTDCNSLSATPSLQKHFFYVSGVAGQSVGQSNVVTCSFWWDGTTSRDESFTASVGMKKYFAGNTARTTNLFDVTRDIYLRLYGDDDIENYRIHSLEVSIWRR